MTDKELKKLSRLEILELLLEQTKLNEQLKLEIEEIRKENEALRSITVLAQLTEQMNSALASVDVIAKNLRSVSGEEQVPETQETEKTEVQPSVKEPEKKSCESSKSSAVNRNLYSRLLYYYWKNEEALDALPDDLREEVSEKLRGILNGRK